MGRRWLWRGCEKAPLLFWVLSYWGIGMTDAQREVYAVIDEWWRRFGFGPSIEDIMGLTGDKSKANVHRKVKALIRLGVCKGVPGMARSVRPSYLRVHKLG